MATTKAFLQSDPLDWGPIRSQWELQSLHSTCPVVFLEWTRHHNTWGKLVFLRHFLEISLTLGRKCVTFPQYTQGTHHSGGPPLTLTPEWAETLGFSSTIKYCWINSKKYECQTSQCETHQAPPFHTLNNWGGSPISEVIIKKQTNNKQKKPVHSFPFVWNKGPNTLLRGTLGLPLPWKTLLPHISNRRLSIVFI